MNKKNSFSKPLIEIRNLKKYFPLKKTRLFQRHALSVKANDGVDLIIHQGETLGLVGESGCGKSTLGRVIQQLYPTTSGDILYYGYSLEEYTPEYLFHDIKKLPALQKKYHFHKDSIEKLQQQLLYFLEQEQNNDSNKELLQKITDLKSEIELSKTKSINKLGMAINTKSLKQLESYLTSYNLIQINNQKIQQFKLQIDHLHNEYEKAKNIINQKAIDEYESLIKQLETVSSNKIGDLQKKIAITKRSISKDAHEVELKIKKVTAEMNVLINDNENAQLKIVSAVDRIVDYHDISFMEMYEAKKEILIKESELREISNKVERSDLKKKISLHQKKMDHIIMGVSQTIGGLILINDFETMTNVLYKRLQAYREIKDNHEKNEFSIIKKNALLKQLNKEDITPEKKEYFTLLVDRLSIEINKSETSTTGLRSKIAEYDKQLDNLRNEVKNDPKYDEYEANKILGVDLSRLKDEEVRKLRKDLQIIFQDPYSSLNPRLTVGQIIGEGLRAHGMSGDSEENKEYILSVMEKCGLAPYMLHRYPHQFSGGQRQRIGIARALAVNPKFIVCDEAVSALDVSIQSQIINLLEDLKEQDNLTYLFISHDLSVIRHISNRIGVMYLGKIVELADKKTLFSNPSHPYTKALISAIPTTDDDKSERIILKGDIPSNVFPPSGCKFRTRCPIATNKCSQVVPEFREVEPGHHVACHYYEKTKDIKQN